MSSQSSSQGQGVSKKLIFGPGAIEEPQRGGQFTKGRLSHSQLHPDPINQFQAWFLTAQEAGIPQCEACTFASAELPSGRVSARVVYLKELDDSGFVIYSNWDTSRKAADIATNPNVALTFWWRELERQVRVEGKAERITQDEAQKYFDTRIRGSRIGAWASAQSTVLASRDELDERVAEVMKRFEGQDHIPVPEFWGGVRVKPDSVEFWQGRESRLHDRFYYSKDGTSWKIERLSP